MEDEDWLQSLMYLVTHTVSCFVTDIPTAMMSNWMQQHSDYDAGSRTLSFSPTTIINQTGGEAHHHGDGGALQHLFGGHFKEWLVGEGVGDLVAIPATMAVQTFAPDMMSELRKPLEALFGAYYLQAAERVADRWALKHGVEIGSEAHYERRMAHYNKEMDLLPQSFVWTVVSMAVGIAAQKYVMPGINKEWGNSEEPLGKMLAISVAGKILTGIAANGPRLMWPDATDRLEHKMQKISKHVFGHKGEHDGRDPDRNLIAGSAARESMTVAEHSPHSPL